MQTEIAKQGKKPKNQATGKLCISLKSLQVKVSGGDISQTQSSVGDDQKRRNSRNSSLKPKSFSHQSSNRIDKTCRGSYLYLPSTRIDGRTS